MQRFRVFPQYGSFRYLATVDGIQYLLRFKWLERIGSWYLDLMEPDGTEILMGNRMVISWPLTLTHRDTRKPQGVYLLLDLDGVGLDIDAQDQLGDSHRMVFLLFEEFVVPSVSPNLTITPVP